MTYYGNESCRWDYKDIRRVRRVRDMRPIPLPRADKDLRQLGSGLTFTMASGSAVSVQVVDRSPWVNQWWAVVYQGAAFAGEMRLLTVSGPDKIAVSGQRYRPNGKRAHADGTECPCGYPCKECWL
jgi:hypothetical protein